MSRSTRPACSASCGPGRSPGGRGDRRPVRPDRADPAGLGVIELLPQPGQGHLLLRVQLSKLGGIGQVVTCARRLLDADADPAAIGAALGADEILGPLVRAQPGLRVPGAYDGFELAVRAVLGQQVSVAAARTFAGRLAARYGTPLPPSPAESSPAEPSPAEPSPAEPSPADPACRPA